MFFMFESFFIALVQGITEFLPISSAGHLITIREILGFAKQALIIDVAAHAGTLAAAMVYFRSEIKTCLKGIMPSAESAERHLVCLVIIASLPVLIIGALIFYLGIIEQMRDIKIVAVANLIFAVGLFLADRVQQKYEDFKLMTSTQALFVGLAQTMALIPGASRSGTVISAVRVFGFSRSAAASFALFLALPSIAGAVFLTATQLTSFSSALPALAAAFLSFVVAFLVLAGFIRFSQHFSMTIFVIYRLALSALLFMLILN